MVAKVVHCKKSLFDVYIGRPSKWGNPFAIGKDGTREEVIQKYEDYIRSNSALLECVLELDGKVLGCWCFPKPCHGDILAKIIEERKHNMSDKTVRGPASVVNKNKWGFWSLKVNDEWYGTGSKDDPNVAKGAVVEFEAESTQKNGNTYWNVKKGTLKVVAAQSSSGDSGSGSSDRMTKDDWAMKDLKIQWQSARNAAIDLAGTLGIAGAFPFTEKTTPAKKQEVILAFVDKLTKDFYEDVTSLGEAAKEDPLAPPEESDMAGEE